MSARQTSTSGIRRKVREDRRQEIIDTACTLAITDGLAGITARRVARLIGVQSGLVTHYFPAIEDLITAAFVQLASRERGQIADRVGRMPSAIDQLRTAIAAYTAPSRDPMGLLWLDAWRQAAGRSLLRDAVIQQMELDVSHLEAIIRTGSERGEFTIRDTASAVAMRILALLDGQAVSCAIRGALAHSSLNYPAVEELLIGTAERELGLPAGTLAAH